MKKRVYALLVSFLLLFSGCNLFSGLDKEKLDGNSFDYKLEESMASGDYLGVLNLITNKISGTAELKAVDDALKAYEPDSWESATESELEAYCNNVKNYYKLNTGSSVSYYIKLKLLQAEANLGLAGLKMTTIISQITNATKTTKVSVNTLDIGELVPNGLKSKYLNEAVKAYVMGLPTEKMLDEYKLRYLNGALTSAISAVNRSMQLFAVDVNADVIVFKKWSNLTSAEINEWNNKVELTKMELKVAKELLILFGTSSDIIDKDDLDEIKKDVEELISKIVEFDESKYNDFAVAAGFEIEP